MTIYNADGSPYQTSGTLNIFDPSFALNKSFIDSELIELFRIAGSPVAVYEMILDPVNVDPIYSESRSKLYSQEPKEIHVLYDPLVSQFAQSGIGLIDFAGDYVLEASRAEMVEVFGKEFPPINSRVFLPFLGENLQIVAVKNSIIQYWNIFGVQLICQKFQYSETDNSMSQSTNARTQSNYEII